MRCCFQFQPIDLLKTYLIKTIFLSLLCVVQKYPTHVAWGSNSEARCTTRLETMTVSFVIKKLNSHNFYQEKSGNKILFSASLVWSFPSLSTDRTPFCFQWQTFFSPTSWLTFPISLWMKIQMSLTSHVKKKPFWKPILLIICPPAMDIKVLLP